MENMHTVFKVLTIQFKGFTYVDAEEQAFELIETR